MTRSALCTLRCRFGKKPKRGIKKKRVRLQHVLHLVFGCYDNKIVADQADDAVMRAGGSFVTQRQPMPDFVYDFLMNKFGLARYSAVPDCPRLFGVSS